MNRLMTALQRAHALREQNRLGLQADAPACRLDEAPLPPIVALDPTLVSGDVEAASSWRDAKVRLAIFAAAGLVLAILVAWYLLERPEPPQPQKAQGLKMEQQLHVPK